MKVCIVGCGALGGLLACFLSRSGVELTVVDRGRQYEAIRDNGLVLVDRNGDRGRVKNIEVSDSLQHAGDFDTIFLAVKAHEIGALAEDLSACMNSGSVLVTLQNGIPWWYFHNHAGPWENHVIEATDPGGFLSTKLNSHNIIGCVAYPAAEVAEPGVIHHIEGVRFPLGELSGRQSPRVQKIADTLVGAGLKAPVLDDIRSEIWLKAWGNLAFNPISALTHATMSQIATYEPSRKYVIALMHEAEEVAKALGINLRVPLERRLQGAAKVGNHKTSMLQDSLTLRPMEIDAILGAVIEIADLVEYNVPHLASLYALCSLRNTANLAQARDMSC